MSATDCVGVELIVPTLRVGMQPGTLRVPNQKPNAERPLMHSHAEHGNEQSTRRNQQFPKTAGMLNPFP